MSEAAPASVPAAAPAAAPAKPSCAKCGKADGVHAQRSSNP